MVRAGVAARAFLKFPIPLPPVFWKNTNMANIIRSLAAFCCIIPLSQFPTKAAQPAEAYSSLTEDGGWCWFADPRAVARDGKTYTGWVTEDGSVQAACLEHASGKVTRFNLHERYQRDDHNNPSFVFLPDGRLRAFYTKHGAANEINTRVTKRPGDITAWDDEQTIVPADASPRNSGITYTHPFLLSAEGDALHLFWRGISLKPTTAKSSDGGRTWSEGKPVFSLPGLPKGNRPYAKYAANGRDRIHMVFTDGHPRNEPTNSVYYACYRAGAFYRADGSRICGEDELPIRPEQADRIYTATAEQGRAWIWEIAFDAQERPVVVYTRHPTETDHRYHYARWTGSEWFDTELCAAGKWFPQTQEGKVEREPHYSSGLALDPENPAVVYLTRPVKGVRELEKWTTSDGGKTWSSTPITMNSAHDNIRPFVVRHHAADGPTVLWQNLSGRYVHFTDYRCAIKMDRLTAPQPPVSAAMEPAAILNAMERAADWQLANPSRHKPTDWTQGAGYAGIMALAGISGDAKYRDAMLAMASGNGWKLGPKKYFADDHAVGQTYAELYFQYRDPKMIAAMQAQFDDVIANPRSLPTLDFTQRGATDLWSWCDSLFMAPPAWIRLFAATGDPRYRDFAVTNWWRTSDYLYDAREHLYFRDSKYFDKREANGAKIFWSRGNGWVMGGLVRMLQYLPANDPGRAKFEKQFKEMSAAVLKCQQPDGLWRASLLDPASYPLKEASGSGFYTYALAWGINQGLLKREVYEPAARKAWAALVECVEPGGKLTHVQPIGADPKQFDSDKTEIYGVGAFLLAGSEVYRLALREQGKPVRVTVKNPADAFRFTETVSLPMKKLPADPVMMDALTSRILDSQVVGEELLFQVDLAPKDSRGFLVLPGAAVAAKPPPVVKTFARFVPERMDDLAWESDRIAHRMYGPALITGEGTESSGVDVWVKSTRNLVIDKWYKSGNYHKDHGEGLDDYKVSHNATPTRGCGGLGVWDGKRIWVSSNFKTQRVITTGPIRSEFELTYDAWGAGGRRVSEVKRISIDANSNFSRVESTFTTDDGKPLDIAIGMADRQGTNDVLKLDAKRGWVAYWEPEKAPNGNIACGVVVPGGVEEFTNDGVNHLAIVRVRPGKPLVYYLGAGWSKSGDFLNAEAWSRHVEKISEQVRQPLKVALK